MSTDRRELYRNLPGYFNLARDTFSPLPVAISPNVEGWDFSRNNTRILLGVRDHPERLAPLADEFDLALNLIARNNRPYGERQVEALTMWYALHTPDDEPILGLREIGRRLRSLKDFMEGDEPAYGIGPETVKKLIRSGLHRLEVYSYRTTIYGLTSRIEPPKSNTPHRQS